MTGFVKGRVLVENQTQVAIRLKRPHEGPMQAGGGVEVALSPQGAAGRLAQAGEQVLLCKLLAQKQGSSSS